MLGIFDKIKEKVLTSEDQSDDTVKDDKRVDNLIALGVLLWVVAESDEKFLPEEKEQIEEVLRKYSHINDQDMPIVLRSIEEASLNRIDIHAFSREVKEDLERDKRIEVIEHLFQVACADNELDEKEHETIRQIASLMRLDHNEFINAKLKIKKEFGMDTAGL